MCLPACLQRRQTASLSIGMPRHRKMRYIATAAFGCAVWACLATRNWTRECADGPAGGWHCSSRRVADRRWPMARGERAGGWWPVGGLARTKLAALRATRLLPCVVTLGLASNTPRRRPLNASAQYRAAVPSGRGAGHTVPRQAARRHWQQRGAGAEERIQRQTTPSGAQRGVRAQVPLGSGARSRISATSS